MDLKPTRPVRLLVAIGLCVVSVVLAVLFVDRPASTWSHDHFQRPTLLNRFSQYADPVPVAATLFLSGAGVAAIFFGWAPDSRGQAIIAACVAVLVGEAVKEQLKHFFGRPWPETWNSSNPSWIGSHDYGFKLLHGGSGWDSFPSGHTTQVAAIATVIWFRMPKYRWFGVALVALVAIAMWAMNFHFVGDIIAGAFLGTACGWGIVSIIFRVPPDEAVVSAPKSP